MTCRLYLTTPPALLEGTLELSAFKAAFVEALEGGDVACVLLAGESASPTLLEEAVQTLCPLAQERDVAFLVEDNDAVVATLGCDGVHLSDPTLFKQVRTRLGTDYIVGVDCGVSRHDAILVGEGGADYIAFNNRRPLPEIEDPEVREFEEGGPKGLELLTWWQTMMTPPCVSLDDIALEDCAAHAAAGADFIALGRAVWEHSGGPGAAVTKANAAIG